MRKQTLHVILFLLFGLAGLGLFVLNSKPATAANPTTINFQGKVVNSDGTNVANNTYSFVFRIYNTASPTMTTSCTSTATCLWQETQASVQVTNGVFQVELGAACALTSAACNNTAGGPINFGTNNAQYLTMQFNGDTSGANGGFMSPTIHLTSVPFALNSDQLGGISASGFIQNTTSPQATSNFNISGTGIAGTALQAPSFDSATANGALGIGSTNAGAFTIGNVTNSTFLFRAKSQAAAYQLQNAGGNELLTIDTSATEANNLVRFGKASTINGRIVFNNSTNTNTATIVSGVTSTSYTLTLPTALPGSTQCLQSTSGGVLSFASCGGGSSTLATTYSNGAAQADSTITLDSTRLGVIIQDAATPISGNLFTVQKNVGGTQSYFSVTTSAVTLQDTAGYNALVFDSTTSELKIYENVASPTNYARIYYASGEAVFAASSGTTRVGSGSGNITMSLTNPSDLFTFTHTGSLVAAYSSSDFTVTRNLTAGANTATGSVLKVEDLTTFSGGSSAPNVLLVNQNNSSATGNLINAQLAASSKFLVNTAGSITIASGANITVGASAGSSTTCSGGQVLQNQVVTGGVTTGGSCATAGGDLQSAYNADASGEADIVTTSGTKTVLIKAGSTFDSQNLFHVQTASGVDIIKVDTETASDPLEFQIGDSTDDASAIFLGLDNESTFTEATSCTSAINGSVYYNSGSNAVRACINGAWEDMVSTAGLGLQLFGVVPDTGPSGEEGDLGSLVSAGVSGPCKVSWASATTVNIRACTAYSGGRKIVYGGTTGLTISLTNTIDWVHVCFTSSGTIEARQSVGATDDTNLPTYSNTSPLLCLADITNGGTGTSIVRIHDVRTFTTTIKEHVTINAATGLGRVVTQSATVGLVQNPAATLGLIGIRGVIVATSGSASTTTRNAIIASEGPQFIKGAGTSTVNQFAQTSGTTAGYTSSTATADADGYANIGLNQRTIDTTCTAATNCQFSQLVNMSLR